MEEKMTFLYTYNDVMSCVIILWKVLDWSDSDGSQKSLPTAISSAIDITGRRNQAITSKVG